MALDETCLVLCCVTLQKSGGDPIVVVISFSHSLVGGMEEV